MEEALHDADTSSSTIASNRPYPDEGLERVFARSSNERGSKTSSRWHTMRWHAAHEGVRAAKSARAASVTAVSAGAVWAWTRATAGDARSTADSVERSRRETRAAPPRRNPGRRLPNGIARTAPPWTRRAKI